jgi:signal peptidase II
VKKGILALMLGLALLVIDQVIKIAVKMNMAIGDRIEITKWFYIDFIENNGMAWGMELGNKLFLSLFRIVAVVFLCWYIWKQVRKNAPTTYIVLLTMICAGAAGNIIDSLLYGQIFTESTPWAVSQLTSFGDGYAPILMGRVVDMFYFPIIDTILPSWVPIWGDTHFVFFSPIFNFADSCISVGVIILLFYLQKK